MVILPKTVFAVAFYNVRNRALSEEEYYTKFDDGKNELFRVDVKIYYEFRDKAKEEIRKQELADGWDGLKYSQNNATKKEAVQALQNKYGIQFSVHENIQWTEICLVMRSAG